MPSRDQKLGRLASASIAQPMSREELLQLGRACDIVTIPAGTALQRANERTLWCWAILNGTATVSQGAQPLALATQGSWVLEGLSASTAHTSVVAASDVEVAVFKRLEMLALLEAVPALSAAVSAY